MTSFYHCPPIISLKLRVHFDFEELRAQLEEDLGDAPEEVAKRGWRGYRVSGHDHTRQLRLRYGDAGRGVGAGIDLAWPPLE